MVGITITMLISVFSFHIAVGNLYVLVCRPTVIYHIIRTGIVYVYHSIISTDPAFRSMKTKQNSLLFINKRSVVNTVIRN